MKPASVINRGETFVTLRATTDRPSEIQEALAVRDVQHVFKGDQNQAWDAVLANHCLARAVGDGPEITFFVQDERLGTSDTRLLRDYRASKRRYVLTEDYYRGRSGAVWEHQDVSYGLLFTEAVTPEQFERVGVHLHRVAREWEAHHQSLVRDRDWAFALGLLGVPLPDSEFSPAAVTLLGSAVNAKPLQRLFASRAATWIHYAFTKTDGLYGVVPVENDNVTLSSIPLADPDLQAAGRWLLIHAAARGAMRMAGSAAVRRSVKNRARQLAEWAGRFLETRPGSSVADLQEALGEWLTAEVFPFDRLDLDRASRFTRVGPADLPDLHAPEQTLHFFLDLALRFPQEFTDAYNEALNRVGFGLQRIRYEPQTGFYTPPFFVELAPGGPGTSVYRYGLELSGTAGTTVALLNPVAGDIVLESPGTVRSVHALAKVLLEQLEQPDGVSLIGKAAAFSAELQRAPRGLGLPRQGSKYSPLVDHLVAGLRARGVLRSPSGLLIRIGLNALDRLDSMGEVPLRLPRFLHGALPARITAAGLAHGWRAVAAEAHSLLNLLARFQPGQYVHLIRVICLNAQGEDWETALATERKARAARGLNPSGGPLSRLKAKTAHLPDEAAALRRLGCDIPPAAVACMKQLLHRRDTLLDERRSAAARAAAARAGAGCAGGRLMPCWPEEQARERREIECRLLLLFAAYVRRLYQRADSLTYANDRPYALALYLLFGPDIFPKICREVEFDVEYVSPTLHHCESLSSAPSTECVAGGRP